MTEPEPSVESSVGPSTISSGAPKSADRSPWDRVREARILQLLGVYAGGSFAVMQVADIFMNRLGLPDWTFFGVVLVLLAGVPVVLLTALVQSGGRSIRLRGVFTWRNAGLAGGAAVLGLGLLVGAFVSARTLGIGPMGSLVAAGVIDRQEAILIADFQSPTGDSVLAGAITEAFRIDFEQSTLVRVVPPGTVRDGLLRMQRPPDAMLVPELARELALREGIKALLLGEVNSAGGGTIVSVRMVSPDSEEAIVSFRETAADADDVIRAVDRLSSRLRERLGESLRSIRSNEPLERVSTASLPALRLYSQGVRAIDREQDPARGIVLLEEALAHDSTFAMAWRKLGVTLTNRGDATGRWSEALTRAYELSDRLTEQERYLARGTYYGSVLEDPDRAILAYQSLLELSPGHSTALNNLAVQYSARGDRRRAAEALQKAIEVDPHSVVYYTNLMAEQVALRDWTAAEATRSLLEERFPDLGVGAQMELMVNVARGRHIEAERAALAFLERPGLTSNQRADILGGLVSLALIRGRVLEAERRFAELRDAGESLGFPLTGPVETQFRARVALQVLADTASAIKLVEEIVEQERLPPEAAMEGAHIQIASFFLAARHVDAARRYLDEWDRHTAGRAPPQWSRELRKDLGARIEIELGDRDEGFRFLRSKARANSGSAADHSALARAEHLFGEPDRAIQAYRVFLDLPDLYRLEVDAGTLVPALLALGGLLEERDAPGDRAEAREHYLRFVALWQDADPQLQPRVEAIRERIATLPAGRGG